MTARRKKGSGISTGLKWLFYCLFTGLLANIPGAHGRVIKTLDYVYYSFSAENDASDLYPEARAASPNRKKDGKVFLGYTKWEIRWNYRFEKQDGGCRISSHTVRLNAVVTLPKLINAMAAQHERFNAYLPKLKAHELNHVAISMKYAEELDRFLSGKPFWPTCETLKQEIRERGQKQVSLAREANRRYDLETGHGKTEGAGLRESR